MEWFQQLFSVHSSIQTVVVLSLIVSLGLALGKFHVRGISLGVAFVFFVGILAGHVGFNIDSTTLDYAETFGLSVQTFLAHCVMKAYLLMYGVLL